MRKIIEEEHTLIIHQPVSLYGKHVYLKNSETQNIQEAIEKYLSDENSQLEASICQVWQSSNEHQEARLYVDGRRNDWAYRSFLFDMKKFTSWPQLPDFPKVSARDKNYCISSIPGKHHSYYVARQKPK